MCGEMAGDPQFVPLLLGMGLRSFSVAPALAAQIKKVIRTVSLDDARGLAERVLAADSREAVLEELSSQAEDESAKFNPPDIEMAD